MSVDFRSIFYTVCFVFLASIFTPNFIHCMKGSSAAVSDFKEAGQVESTPIDVFAGVLEQIVDRSIGSDGCEANIEKIYGPNIIDVRDIIQKNRDRIFQQDLDQMDPELRQIFNSCLNRHNFKIQRFAARNNCKPCVVAVLILLIFFFIVQQNYL